MKACNKCRLLIGDPATSCPKCHGSITTIRYDKMAAIIYEHNGYSHAAATADQLQKESAMSADAVSGSESFSDRCIDLEAKLASFRTIDNGGIRSTQQSERQNCKQVFSEASAEDVCIQSEHIEEETINTIFSDIPPVSDKSSIFSDIPPVGDNSYIKNRHQMYHSDAETKETQKSDTYSKHIAAPNQRTAARRARFPNTVGIRWGRVVLAVLILCMLILIVTNWHSIFSYITSLFSQVLVVATVIATVVLLIYFLLFPNGRRRR